MKIYSEVFRKYDIRGLAESQIDAKFACLLGSTLAQESASAVLLAYDCRLQSRLYHDALALGLMANGADVISLGMIPSPCLYFSEKLLAKKAGVMVTASHNSREYNGFKIWSGEGTLSEGDIHRLQTQMANLAEKTDFKAFHEALEGQGDSSVPISSNISTSTTAQKISTSQTISTHTDVAGAEKFSARFRALSFSAGFYSEFDPIPRYLDSLERHIRALYSGDFGLRVVVDGNNGVAGQLCCALLRRLGAEVIPLYCEPDGNFPHHAPDPIDQENSRDLCDAVLAHHADFGVGLDGDGDRLAAVDRHGRQLPSDVLLSFFLHDLMQRRAQQDHSQPLTVLADVKCSQRIFQEIRDFGGKAIMCPTGHSLMRQAMRRENALLGGELAGHFFHSEGWFGFDDGILGAAKILGILAGKQLTLEDFPLWTPVFSTPEIVFPCREQDKAPLLEELRRRFAQYPLCEIDGIRVDVPGGWFLARASNTGAHLSLRFEAETPERLREIYEDVEQILLGIQKM